MVATLSPFSSRIIVTPCVWRPAILMFWKSVLKTWPFWDMAISSFSSSETILAETMRLLEDREEYTRRSRAENLYGDGQASLRIAQILASHPVLT